MLQKRPMTPPPFCFLSGIQPRHPKSSPFRKKIFNQHWHCQWQASLKTENLAKKYNRHGIAAISRLPKIPLKERRREGLSLTTDIQYPLPHKKQKISPKLKRVLEINIIKTTGLSTTTNSVSCSTLNKMWTFLERLSPVADIQYPLLVKVQQRPKILRTKHSGQILLLMGGGKFCLI